MKGVRLVQSTGIELEVGGGEKNKDGEGEEFKDKLGQPKLGDLGTFGLAGTAVSYRCIVTWQMDWLHMPTVGLVWRAL